MEALVERAQGGAAAALETLLGQLAPAIQRFGMRMCKNPPDADDVLQDTLLTIATRLPEFEGRSSLTSWVFTIVRTACVRKRRGLKNQPPVSSEGAAEMADPGLSPEAITSDRELSRALTRALDGLSDEHREVLLLRDMEGLSAPEAAESLGISVDALKSRLHRAREALRLALKPVLEAGAPPPTPQCPDVLHSWSEKLEGDLRQEDCAAMEKHVASCPSCGAACSALKEALLMCRRAATDVELDPKVQLRVKAAVRDWLRTPSGITKRVSPPPRRA